MLSGVHSAVIEPPFQLVLALFWVVSKELVEETKSTEGSPSTMCYT